MDDLVDVARLTCGSFSLCELAQLFFRNSKFRSATIHADNNLRKYPHDGLINILQFGKMDAHLPAEFLLVDDAHVLQEIPTSFRAANGAIITSISFQ